MTTKLSGYYQQAYASHSKHFNQCFYCGCEATERDYCPPLHMMQSIIDLGEDAEFISIPACYECFALLHNERVLTIDGRFTKVKKKIANKDLHHNVDYTPYEGKEINTLANTVISRGAVIIKDKKLLSKMNHGKFLKSEISDFVY